MQVKFIIIIFFVSLARFLWNIDTLYIYVKTKLTSWQNSNIPVHLIIVIITPLM